MQLFFQLFFKNNLHFFTRLFPDFFRKSSGGSEKVFNLKTFYVSEENGLQKYLCQNIAHCSVMYKKGVSGKLPNTPHDNKFILLCEKC